MENFKLKILKVTTSVQKDSYKRETDSNGIFSSPKQFVVAFECETVVDSHEKKEVEKVYFKHTFDFSETMSRVGGMIHPCKKESEFVLFLEGKKENHVGGLRMDESYFTCYGQFISKFQEGERIWVKGTAERKESKLGNKYVNLKRVKVDREYYYHS